MKLTPGINHIEIWVKDVPQTMAFFAPILGVLGWKQLNDFAFCTDYLEIFFKRSEAPLAPSLGVRHICLQAVTKEQVDQVGAYLASINADIIRGPKEMPYTQDYYTVDFRDPNGLVYEVAYTPNMVL
jgi:catechol 2,3-dioxygenase-like lactoylglutathione lyase family enzyme